MRERMWQAVADVRARLAAGWEVWETTAGSRWAREKNWRVESTPMTEDEESIVDYVLQEEQNHETP